MSDHASARSAIRSAGRHGHDSTAGDRKGGPGHTVLVAVLVAVPVVKIAWTVGSPAGARDVITALGVTNLPEVLVGMLLESAALGCLVGVLLSRMIFAAFAARGAVPRGQGMATLVQVIALTVVNPVAVGILAACLYGPWWGLGTGLIALALRQGVAIEYRTGRRGHGGDAAARRSSWLGRLAGGEQLVVLVLAVVALPFTAMTVALDGHAWNSVLRCTVDSGTARPARERVIELRRNGGGVVGWNLGTHEVSNGVACVEETSRVVRPPWWDA